MALALARLQAASLDRDSALRFLETVPPSLERAAIYYQLSDYENAIRTYSAVRANHPDNTLARIGVIKSVAAMGHTEQLDEEVRNLITDMPTAGLGALLVALATVSDGTISYDKMVETLLVEYGVPQGERTVDERLAYLGLLTRQAQFAEAMEGYQALKVDMPGRPSIKLRWARLLLRNRFAGAPHHYDQVVAAYDEYLKLKPYDVHTWKEKARFLGWVSEYQAARDEYHAIIARFPHDRSTQLELAAKESLWRHHYRSAFRFHTALLDRDPHNEEALGDLGQMHSARLRFGDSQRYYRRIVADNPRHDAARESLNLAQLFSQPQVTIGAGAVNVGGFQDALRTDYLPVTVEFFAPVQEDVWVGAGYQWVDFNVSGSPSTANIGRIMGRYTPTEYWHVDGYLGVLEYQPIDETNVNFGLGLSYELESGVHTRIETGRQDVWQNAQTLQRNISSHTYAAGADYHITEPWSVQVGGGFWDYSDDNWNLNGQVSTRYDLLPFPHPLSLTYLFETFGFDRRSIYFSPGFFAKQTLAIGWQHVLGFPRRREHHSEAPVANRYSGTNISHYLGWPVRPEYDVQTPVNAYSVNYGISLDDDRHSYHQVTATVNYALTRGCHLNVTALFIRSSVVDQNTVNGFFQCHL